MTVIHTDVQFKCVFTYIYSLTDCTQPHTSYALPLPQLIFADDTKSDAAVQLPTPSLPSTS